MSNNSSNNSTSDNKSVINSITIEKLKSKPRSEIEKNVLNILKVLAKKPDYKNLCQESPQTTNALIALKLLQKGQISAQTVWNIVKRINSQYRGSTVLVEDILDEDDAHDLYKILSNDHDDYRHNLFCSSQSYEQIVQYTVKKLNNLQVALRYIATSGLWKQKPFTEKENGLKFFSKAELSQIIMLWLEQYK